MNTVSLSANSVGQWLALLLMSEIENVISVSISGHGDENRQYLPPTPEPTTLVCHCLYGKTTHITEPIFESIS
jgi:hypothetical protein